MIQKNESVSVTVPGDVGDIPRPTFFKLVMRYDYL